MSPSCCNREDVEEYTEEGLVQALLHLHWSTRWWSSATSPVPRTCWPGCASPPPTTTPTCRYSARKYPWPAAPAPVYGDGSQTAGHRWGSRAGDIQTHQTELISYYEQEVRKNEEKSGFHSMLGKIQGKHISSLKNQSFII